MKLSSAFRLLFGFGLLLVFFVSCDPGDGGKGTAGGVDSTDSVRPTNADCAANKYLPVLWVELDELLKANGAVTFRFYIDDWKDLTLHGWQQPFNRNPPFIKLKTSVLSNTEAGPGNYLGNLILTAPMLARIRQQAGSGNFTSIKFYPVIDQRAGSAGQVTYKYELTSLFIRSKVSIPKDSLMITMQSVMFNLTDTTNFADENYLNPSPPRNEQ